MKSRMWSILLLCGLIVLIGLIGFLINRLFKLSVDVNKTANSKQPAMVSPLFLTDTVIEVGDDSKKNAALKIRDRPKVTQYSSGLAPKEQKPTKKNEPVGEITHLSGIASVMDQTGKARLLTVNNEILRMDKIETGPNTKLEIKFSDGTVISQGEKSVVVIEECIFDPANPAGCCFILRFTRGICRVVTGLITDINPRRFKVKARMASAGIRGCDLVFKSTPLRNDIYVLDMGRARSVEIETTSDGSPVTDINTGGQLAVEENKKRQITITEPQTVVSVVSGKEPEHHNIGMDEARGLITETSNLIPARYELQQKANGAILKILPGKTAGNPTTTPQQK